MAKQFDYYAGYPNQQKTPKWVGVAIGSIFGGMTLIMLAIGIRIAFPARAAEASVAAVKTEAPLVAAAVLATDDGAPVVAADLDPSSKNQRGSRHHAKAKKSGGGAVRLASSKPSKSYKKVQLFAKSVSGSRRDKRARDDLDKMLGL